MLKPISLVLIAVLACAFATGNDLDCDGTRQVLPTITHANILLENVAKMYETYEAEDSYKWNGKVRGMSREAMHVARFLAKKGDFERINQMFKNVVVPKCEFKDVKFEKWNAQDEEQTVGFGGYEYFAHLDPAYPMWPLLLNLGYQEKMEQKKMIYAGQVLGLDTNGQTVEFNCEGLENLCDLATLFARVLGEPMVAVNIYKGKNHDSFWTAAKPILEKVNPARPFTIWKSPNAAKLVVDFVAAENIDDSTITYFESGADFDAQPGHKNVKVLDNFDEQPFGKSGGATFILRPRSEVFPPTG